MKTPSFTNGNDQYWVSELDDSYTLKFLAGDDELIIGWADGGFGGTPSIYSVNAQMGAGNDSIFLSEGTCTVYGETGNDHFTLINARGLRATLYGGDGNDTFEIIGVTDLVANGDSGDDRFLFSNSTSYPDGAVNVLLHGGAGNDVFSGLNKVVSGSLYGDDGNDIFVDFGNSAGSPQLRGGMGNDIYRYHVGTSATFVEGLGEGIDLVQVARGVSYTLGANIENLTALNISGSTAAAATLNGNALNNIIKAAVNNDTINGGAGNDRLLGMGGNDTLIGGIGNDDLRGGIGSDQLYGGTGTDLFVFDDGDFGGLTAATADRVRDFSHAEADRIYLEPVDASSALTGDQAFTFLGTAAFNGSAGQLRYEQIGGNTYVQGDLNGDGAADFWLRLDGLHTLVSGDFIL